MFDTYIVCAATGTAHCYSSTFWIDKMHWHKIWFVWVQMMGTSSSGF